MSDPEGRSDERTVSGVGDVDDLERASENVLVDWPAPEPTVSKETAAVGDREIHSDGATGPADASPPVDEAEPFGPPVLDPEESIDDVPDEAAAPGEHAPAAFEVPPGYAVLAGEPTGGRRAVGVVVSRFNGEITGRLLASALDELALRGVDAGSITVMPVPGAFELPLAAMALAKTRRFACVIALGCVIRGETPHFDYVAAETASGLQVAAIETGVPISFGVLTLERPEQAEERIGKGAEAVRTALEMADLFANLRAAAAK